MTLLNHRSTARWTTKAAVVLARRRIGDLAGLSIGGLLLENAFSDEGINTYREQVKNG